MEIKRATSLQGKTYRIMDDGNHWMHIAIYTIERRMKGLWDNGFECWELEPSSPITSDLTEIETLFNELINA